ncbi:uncharacterized protein B0H18DRAFT_1025751 [Fomitopsis serialis]|uniref:uncharacterized protein n=1 Tax=Fomitopsis serialis TaxID=139415 RepID=UPI002007D16F|nr:uncharacterized protein B0H18DRAFT_1025751 [Neoantrodia serialis]KAH9920064.1 hypothetical protein B0H18DRAFT_1025751 [Neoantrodia serialis]
MAKGEISTVDSAPFWPPNAPPFFVDHSTPQCPRAFIALYFSTKKPRSDSNAHPAMYPFASLPVGPAQRDKTPLRDPQETALRMPNSTPAQPSAHSVLSREDGIKMQRHDDWVKKHFRDKIVWNFDPAKFIQAVWGFGPDDVPTRWCSNTGRRSRNSAPLSFDEAPKRVYILERWERECYEPLAQIANGLLDQMYGPKSSQRRERRALPAQFEKRDTKYEGAYTEEKVDMSFSTVALTPGKWPQWDFEAAFLEVKKTKIGKLPNPAAPQQVNTAAGRATKKGKRKRTSAEEGTRLPKAKRACTPTDGSERAQDGPAADHTQAKADAEHVEDKDDPVRPQEFDLTHNEAQAVRYMNHMMSSNVRSFGIGWLVEDANMRLYYGDRMGIVVTRKFKFLREESGLFMRCIAAMGQASVHGMGIFPDLHFSKNEEEETEFDSYEGSRLRIRARRPDTSEPKPEPFEFDVDVDGEAKRIYTEFGVLGRGTSVIPIKARPDTLAYKYFKAEDLVAKISWPHALRKAEDSLITAVRTKLGQTKRQYLPHIVDLKCSVTRTIDEMKLPRAAMGLDRDEADERVCRVLVMSCYQRLEVVESVDDFKKVYVDVVRAHYWVWTTSRILHRDISTNNIMWYRIDGKLYGVLCDWDLAEENIDGGIPSTRAHEYAVADGPPASASNKEVHGSASATQADAAESELSDSPKKPRYRTGTGPFMALDLLREGPAPFHLYRYDLEAFFYVLAYVGAVWDPENHKFGHLSAWEQETLVDIGRRKQEFLKVRAVYDRTFEAAHPTLKHLAAYEPQPGWITSLAAQFSVIEMHTSTIESLSFQGGIRQGTKYKDKIKRIEAERETEMSYEIFMEILGAPLDI